MLSLLPLLFPAGNLARKIPIKNDPVFWRVEHSDQGGVEKSARRPGEFLRIFASDRIVKSARPSPACRDSPMCRRPDIVFHSAVYETAEFLVRLTEVEVEVT